MIKGNSGCVLKIKNDKTIIKSVEVSNYSARLYAQFQKQLSFNQINKIVGVRAPYISTFGYKENNFYFEMEYYNNSDFIGYLDYCEKAHIDSLVEKLISIIEQYEKLCVYGSVGFDVIEKKFKESLTRLNRHKYNLPLTKILNSLRIKEIFLPVGICHGDLTFSNILFKNNEIILIDFLDSFLESPIQDMVKLRQDTHHFWSLEFADANFDAVKTRIIFEYLDNKLKLYFNTKDYYLKYYKLFQFLNMVRVLPYCTNSSVFDKVLRNIESVINE